MSSHSSPATISLNQIRFDAGTQSRLGGNDANTVHRYAEDMQGGMWDFGRSPLPLLFFDGKHYYPGDGHHRIQAALMSGLSELICDVKPGSHRDAQFYSNTEANKYHGKQLTRKDKRNRVQNLLLDEEWMLMSDREIARQCGVSAPFVGTIRKALIEENQISGDRKRKGKDGKIRDTTKIGRVKAYSPSSNRPLSNRPSSDGSSQALGDQDSRPESTRRDAESSLSGLGTATNPASESAAHQASPDPAYAEVLKERNELMKRIALQQEQHQNEIERLTAESLLGRNDELELALADDEALMQQIYDGLGTIREALDPERPAKDLRQDVQRAARGIDLMRRILEAQAPNLLRDEVLED